LIRARHDRPLRTIAKWSDVGLLEGRSPGAENTAAGPPRRAEDTVATTLAVSVAGMSVLSATVLKTKRGHQLFDGDPHRTLLKVRSASQRSTHPRPNFLWQVVAKRGKEHILGALRREGRSARRIHARPSVADNVRVLRSPLNGPFGPFIEAIPESDRRFDKVSRIGRAVRQGAGDKPASPANASGGGDRRARNRFRSATVITEQRISVPSGLRRNGIEIRCASGKLGAQITVNVQFLPVEF